VNDYHVFLTARGESNGLYVSAQGTAGFTVQERGKGTSSVAFAYRVVARPKSEKTTSRLERFVPPNVPLPDVASLPKPAARPAPPQVPDTPRQPPPSRPAAQAGVASIASEIDASAAASHMGVGADDVPWRVPYRRVQRQEAGCYRSPPCSSPA